MNTNSDRIIDNFHNAATNVGLKYLIIGGFAASYWGKPRFTADIDYVIEESSFELSRRTLEALNYKLVFLHPKKSFAHFAPNLGSGFRVDFMIVNSETWDKLIEASDSADFGGSEKYPIVGYLHLIAMKLHSAKQADRREYLKDLSDIVEIMLAQKLSFEDLKEADIIEKYGTERTLSELKKFIEKKAE
jgi:hypothetical protein